MIVDLHTHSYFSDGIFSPTMIVQKAKENGCDILALTDHDTIKGLDEAKKTAQDLGIKFINGCEFSTTWQDKTIHIVGLNFDENNPELQQALSYHQELRTIRAKNIVSFLEQKGVKNPFEKVKKLATKNMITRTHFARMLVAEKICANMNEVFNKYLGNENKSVKTNWASFDKIIKVINNAGGMAVLAHPLRYKISKAQLKVLIREFAEFGGKAVEVITARTGDNQINHMIGLAHNNNLLFSMGSDFHGDNKFTQIGKLKQIKHTNNIWNYL